MLPGDNLSEAELEPGLAAPMQAQAPWPVWDVQADQCFGSK